MPITLILAIDRYFDSEEYVYVDDNSNVTNHRPENPQSVEEIYIENISPIKDIFINGWVQETVREILQNGGTSPEGEIARRENVIDPLEYIQNSQPRELSAKPQ